MNTPDNSAAAPARDAEAGERPADPNGSRRRMLRAAGVALPSVLTLSSGAAVAAASTLACLANQPTTTAQRFTSTSDKWARVQVYDGKVKGDAAHCVNTPQASCTYGSGKAKDGSIWVENDGTRMTAGPFTTVNNVSQQPKSYGLVYVDRNGTIVTLDPNGDTSLVNTTTSCMNSVIGSQISKLG
jgi:hypothetical protein